MTTLLVRTHGRWDYLGRSLDSIDLDLFDRKILSVDGPPPPSPMPGWELLSTGVRSGLTANVRQAWDALENGEEVFDLPLDEMRAVLEETPHLAQMVLERQPVNPAEFANGGLLGADNIPTYYEHNEWREQRHLFSYNPHLRVHRRGMFPKGWGGTEIEATVRLIASGWTFGFWGAQGDPPRCEHIGVSGGMGSPGWRP